LSPTLRGIKLGGTVRCSDSLDPATEWGKGTTRVEKRFLFAIRPGASKLLPNPRLKSGEARCSWKLYGGPDSVPGSRAALHQLTLQVDVWTSSDGIITYWGSGNDLDYYPRTECVLTVSGLGDKTDRCRPLG